MEARVKGVESQEEKGCGYETREYVGEAIDPRSRKRVRAIVEKHMKSDWRTWWTKGVSGYSRNKLVYECIRDLDLWWLGREGACNACYSPQAVSEEIDYFLPKSFWKHKRGKHRSSGQVVVDPGWKAFEGWKFEYEETIARLKAEYEAMKERNGGRLGWK